MCLAPTSIVRRITVGVAEPTRRYPPPPGCRRAAGGAAGSRPAAAGARGSSSPGAPGVRLPQGLVCGRPGCGSVTLHRGSFVERRSDATTSRRRRFGFIGCSDGPVMAIPERSIDRHRHANHRDQDGPCPLLVEVAGVPDPLGGGALGQVLEGSNAAGGPSPGFGGELARRAGTWR